MSLYGAMMIGVSALDAFSNAMSTTSSNIANVNTIGYKTGETHFSTLLAASLGEGASLNAGVVTDASENVAQQGLLQTASSPTDLAISGNGFFMVNTGSDMSGTNLYTRAGDFNPDADGNLRNSAGYYLMGYALNQDGSVTPGTALSAINVTNLTGKAEPTQNMSIVANLKADTDVTGGYDVQTNNMMSGAVTPDFSTTVNFYDSQGGSQPLTMSWVKTGTNQWNYEITYGGDTNNIGQNGSLPLGMVAAGTVTFNPDGTLAALTSTDGSSTVNGGTLSMSMPWNANAGVASQTIAVAFGTIGATNGMSQFDSASQLTNATVDGALFGTLTGVTVGDDGKVTAHYSNGLTQAIYQVPLATFTNPNGLASVSGNAFAQTEDSGNPVINQSGEGGAGTVQGSALEGSTVDLATEFTNLITTQRAYAASTRVITTASDMLQDLQQIH